MRPLRWPILGAIRFLLALVVASEHLVQRMITDAWVANLARFSAFAAVLGFLVISGFSIAASYEKAPAGFYRRRVLRIWPLYILAIIAGSLVLVNGGESAGVRGVPPVGRIIQNLFFLQGWTTYSIPCNAVVWTLSVEVFCYLLTPVLARLSQALLLLIAGFSAVLYCVYPLRVQPPFNYHLMLHGQSTALLMWCWLLGFIAYRSRNHALAALGVFAVFITAAHFNGNDLGSRWAVTVGLAILGIGFTDKLRGPRWVAATGSLLGDASYPLYLIHMPFYVLFFRLTNSSISSLVILGLVVILAILLDRGFDQPLKKFFSSRFKSAGNGH